MRKGSSLEEGFEVGVEGWETTSEGRKVGYSNWQEQRARDTKVVSSVFAAESHLTRVSECVRV